MILTNGCSFTEGYGLGDASLNWPSQLSRKLSLPVTNLALGGASNSRIARTTREALAQTGHKKLVVIGWTMFDRNELMHEQGYYLRATKDGCIPDSEARPDNLDVMHKHWITHSYNFWLNYRQWLYDVLDLQSHLLYRGVKFKFFTAFGDNHLADFKLNSATAMDIAEKSWQWRDRSMYEPDKELHKEYQELFQLVRQIDLTHWVTRNKDTMQSWLSTRNFQTDNTGHFLQDGHLAWSDRIAEDIL